MVFKDSKVIIEAGLATFVIGDIDRENSACKDSIFAHSINML